MTESPKPTVEVLAAGDVGGVGIGRLVAGTDGSPGRAEVWTGDGWEPAPSWVGPNEVFGTCSRDRLIGVGIPEADLPAPE